MSSEYRNTTYEVKMKKKKITIIIIRSNKNNKKKNEKFERSVEQKVIEA